MKFVGKQLVQAYYCTLQAEVLLQAKLKSEKDAGEADEKALKQMADLAADLKTFTNLMEKIFRENGINLSDFDSSK